MVPVNYNIILVLLFSMMILKYKIPFQDLLMFHKIFYTLYYHTTKICNYIFLINILQLTQKKTSDLHYCRNKYESP